MQKGDKFFAYGTLRPGNSAYKFFLEGRARHVGETSIQGTMYSLGGFPGVRLDGGGRVVGDLFEVVDEGLPDTLDRYEGYPDLYGRRMVRCENGSEAWVYEIGMVPPSANVINSGDWNNRHG